MNTAHLTYRQAPRRRDMLLIRSSLHAFIADVHITLLLAGHDMDVGEIDIAIRAAIDRAENPPKDNRTPDPPGYPKSESEAAYDERRPGDWDT